MKKTILVAMCFALAAFGQDVARIFQLKYADPRQVAQIVNFYGAHVQVEQNLKVISVKGPAAAVAEIESAVKRFDVAPLNVELTIYVLSADQTSAATVPKELDSVAKQLQRVFAYKGLKLLDTQVIRTRVGERAYVSGVVGDAAWGGGVHKIMSYFGFNRLHVQTDEKGRMFRLDELRLGLRLPLPGTGGKAEYTDMGITTTVDIREGQKVVVGKTNPESPDKAAVYVVTANVVE